MPIFVAHPDACDKCQELDGQDLDELPHPNCQCSFISDDEAERGGKKRTATVRKTTTQTTPARRTQSGCRPSQLLGGWLIKSSSFAEMMGYANAHPVPLARRDKAVISKRRVNRAGLDPVTDEEEGEFLASNPCRYPIEDGIARLTISGPMTKYPTSYQEIFGGTSMVLLRNAIRDIAGRDDVGGVLIEIASPGGTVAGTQPLAEDLYRLARIKPVHVHASDDMCSAALWVGSQANFITADPMTWTGSIGVKGGVFDTSAAYERDGIIPYIITNTAGEFKAIGADGAPVKAEHLAQIVKEMDDTFELFIAGVARGRQVTVDTLREYADGRAFISSEALGAGFIDRIGTIDEAMETLRQQVSSGGLVRSRNVRMKTPADERIETMPLTNQQATRAKAIAPLASVGDADLPDKLIDLAAKAGTLETQVTSQNTTIETLTKERNEAQAKAPKPMDPELLEARRDTYATKIEGLRDAGKMPKPQSDAALAMVGETDKGNPVVLQRGADGKCVMDGVLAMFADATPIVPTGEQSGQQKPVQGNTALNDSHVDKGNKTDADAGKEQGSAYAAEQIRQREAANSAAAARR